MSLPHVIELSGSPFERGVTYGEGLRTVIVERDRLWKTILADQWKNSDPVSAFLKGTDFLPAIKAHTPDLLEEVRGIAAGSGLTFEDVLACQLMDEEWIYSRHIAEKHHCSALGSVDGTHGVIGQNMDLIGWMDGFQTIMKVRDGKTGLETIVLTVAGMIGLCGVNSAGLGLCVNTLSSLNSAVNGLPVAFVARSLLEYTGVKEASGFLQTVPHASGQNYLLADGKLIAGYECSAAGCIPWANNAGKPNRRWHTNHPLASRDLVTIEGRDEAAGSQGGSRLRQSRLDAFASGTESMTVGALEVILADKENVPDSICRTLAEAHAHGRQGFTFAGVIWSVGKDPSALVTGGPPDTAPWVAIAFPGKQGHP
jgi:isopenicillin-N N-acyltransferase-like protein